MSSFACAFCKRAFESTRARSAHVARCPQRESVTTKTVDAFQAAGRKRAALGLRDPLPKAKATKIGLASTSFAQRHATHEAEGSVGQDVRIGAQEEQDHDVEAPDELEEAREPQHMPPEQLPPPVPLLERPVVLLERVSRSRRVPKHLADYIPSAAPRALQSQVPQQILAQVQVPTALQPPRIPSPTPNSDTVMEPEIPHTVIDLTYHSTQANNFGLYRIYQKFPSLDPDDTAHVEDMADNPAFISSETQPSRVPGSVFGKSTQPSTSNVSAPAPFYAPFENQNIFRVVKWWQDGHANTIEGLQVLVDDVFRPTSPGEFRAQDFLGFSAGTEVNRLNGHISAQNQVASTSSLPWSAASGWRVGSIRIPVPCPRRKCKEKDAPVYEVKGFYYRNIVEVVKEAFQDEQSFGYHMRTHKLLWQRREGERPMRCWGEAYTSTRAGNMEEELDKLDREPGCTLERVIAHVMLFSDSTHLTNFGNAAMWPIYLSLGNLSKYTRGKPTAFAQHHIAYIPTIPDDFDDWYITTYKVKPSTVVKTHMKRELMQGVWDHLLSEDVVRAYVHGVVTGCADKILRRSYLRFFAYSSDYLEKILLVCIKSLGTCLCPRCLIKKDRVRELGMIRDVKRREQTRRHDSKVHQERVENARKAIFDYGYAVNSERVEGLLRHDSTTPTRNAFSTKLLEHGLDHYDMHPVDMLHDFEVGEWKAIFAHLIRMLHSFKGEDLAEELNRRYRHVPSFLRETIRRFANNVAEMKKLAGRDFEDILQCALPCFEALFPNKEHQKIVLDLLFDLGWWHGLAKLRLHTESTIASLDHATVELGRSMRQFEKITCEYATCELPKEKNARLQRQQKKAQKATGSVTKHADPKQVSKAQPDRRRGFDRKSYKRHSLGDYARSIKYWGTTDSYSTQIGEMEHRRVKRYYARTNKVGHVAQVARIERRGAHLRRMKQKEDRAVADAAAQGRATRALLTVASTEKENLPQTDPHETFHISPSQRFAEHTTSFLTRHAEDPALMPFLDRLKEHLIPRMRGEPDDGRNYAQKDLNAIVFENNRIYPPYPPFC